MGHQPTLASPGGERAGDRTPDPQAVFSALEDPDCRTVLCVLGEEHRTAKELAADCDIPLSTMYRKLDALTDADLLEKMTRVRQNAKNASQYRRSVDDVVVEFAGEGVFDASVGRSSPADGRTATASKRTDRH